MATVHPETYRVQQKAIAEISRLRDRIAELQRRLRRQRLLTLGWVIFASGLVCGGLLVALVIAVNAGAL